MADTIITNTPQSPNNGDSSAGWFVAVVILLAVIGGGIYAYKRGVFGGSAPDTTNINVTIPTPDTLQPTGE